MQSIVYVHVKMECKTKQYVLGLTFSTLKPGAVLHASSFQYCTLTNPHFCWSPFTLDVTLSVVL